MLLAFKTVQYLIGKHNNSSLGRSVLILKNINLIFSCVDLRILYNYLKRFIQQKKIFGLNNHKVSFFRNLIKKRLTVNKSPFVNKKSKNQYEVRLFGSKLAYFFYSSVFYYFFLRNIQNVLHSKNNFRTDFVKFLHINYYL